MSSQTASAGLLPAHSTQSLLDQMDSRSGPETSLSEIQSQTDQFVSTFITEATQSKNLVAMLGAGAAYRFTRIGAMASAAHLLEKSGRILPLLIRAGSYGSALAAESGVFAGMTRGLTLLEGQKPIHSFERDWAQAAFSLGGLKIFGGMAQGQNIILQHLFADTGMVLGNHGASLAGLVEKPQGDLLTQFLHAEALNLQMLSGMSLVHGLSPRLSALERSMDLQLRSQEVDLQRKEQPFFISPSLVAATGSPPHLSNETVGDLPIFMTIGGDGEGSGKALDIPRLKELATRGDQPALVSLIKARDTHPEASTAADEVIQHLRDRKRARKAEGREAPQEALDETVSPFSFKKLFSFLRRHRIKDEYDLMELQQSWGDDNPQAWANHIMNKFRDTDRTVIFLMLGSTSSIEDRLVFNGSRLGRKEVVKLAHDYVTIMTADRFASQGNRLAREELENYDVEYLTRAAEREPYGVGLLKILAKYRNQGAFNGLQAINTTQLVEMAANGNTQAVSALAHLAAAGNRQAKINITTPLMIGLFTSMK